MKILLKNNTMIIIFVFTAYINHLFININVFFITNSN